MENERNNLSNFATEVAITGSPNTVTEIHFDVRSTYLRTPLLGSLLALNVPVDSREVSEELLVLGQVATIKTQNRWHEDQSLKNYIKLQGRLPHLTEIGDITTGTLQILGAYRKIQASDTEHYEKTRLSVPPGSGLRINQVDAEVVREIMSRDFGYGYLGNFYGTQNVPAPVYVRHFGDFAERGTGEAYMGGVFGPSGSGKSVIAASLISLWSHNPQMGILILDPQSEFTENAFARGTSFDFNFHQLLGSFSRSRFNANSNMISLDQIQLEGAEMFVEILNQKGFFRQLGVGSPKIQDAVEDVGNFLESLRDAQIWTPSDVWHSVDQIQIPATFFGNRQQGNQTFPFPDSLAQVVANVYAASSRGQKQQEFLTNWRIPRIQTIWDETAELFQSRSRDGRQRRQMLNILRDCVLNGQILILDLNPIRINLEQDFKLYLIEFVFRRLRQLTHIHYRQGNPGNCLIVLDEAGRFIPQSTGDNIQLQKVCTSLVNSVKEMRKMRCGFMFITQTIAEIQKEIYRNLHYRIYGVGLGVGADSEHIKAREGTDAFELYTSLPDPRLSGTFSFLVAGVLLALGSSGRPMVIEGFSSGDALLENNRHLLSNGQRSSLSGIGEIVI